MAMARPNWRQSAGSYRNRRNLGRHDPNIQQIMEICESEDTAVTFCKENGLLPVIAPNQAVNCWRAGCGGTIYEAERMIRGRAVFGFRCHECRSFRSLKNGGALLGQAGGHQMGTFFARIDATGRPTVKLQVRVVLLIVWCWSKRFSREKTLELLHGLIGNDGGVLTDWFNYIREICSEARQNAPPMGSAEISVQIDECYLRGRRKNNVGRIQRGNQVPPARANYGNSVVGPWVFGLVCRLPDARREVRLFSVLRRNITTLRPIVQANVSPGTMVFSDEWRAYRGLNTWSPNPALPFRHRTVNHSQNFVDPVTGAHTQQIERMWKDCRTRFVRLQNGRRVDGPGLQLILDEFWWFSLHDGSPFFDMVDEIRQMYPQQ